MQIPLSKHRIRRNPKMSITTIEEVDFEQASSVGPSVKQLSLYQSEIGKSAGISMMKKPPNMLQRQRTSQVFMQHPVNLKT
mmetsp:Transcript_10506/g.16090  ORF Transcript_10506/g.16090 Transcript_10506/m.16090 type:complete len:81 (-) Transcript_10506:4685-4927(-)